MNNVNYEVAPANSIPHIDLTIDDTAIIEGSKQLLKHIRPTWDIKDVHFNVFTEGYSNQLLSCTLKNDLKSKVDVILVRIYGRDTEKFIDRENERHCMQLLHSQGSAAELYCEFNNGIAYGFTPGIVLNYELAQDNNIQKMVTRELAKIHSIDRRKVNAVLGKGESCDGKAVLFRMLDLYLQLIPAKFCDSEKQLRYESLIPSREKILSEIDCLRKELTILNSPIVLCHNDLLFNNIIYDQNKEKVMFIDFEYMSNNYQAFDIANHFCEFAGMDVIDFSRYPNKAYQLQWLHYYLEAYYKEQGNSCARVSDVDTERLYVQVNKFALACHICWGLWGLVQAHLSAIDYDYLDFAACRFSEYFKRKEEYLALEMP